MSSVTPAASANSSASMAGRLKPGGPVFNKLNVEQTNRRIIEGGKNISETIVKGDMERNGITEKFTRNINVDHLKIDGVGGETDLQNMFKTFQNIKIPAGDLSFDMPSKPAAPKTEETKPSAAEKPRGAASEMPIYQMFGSQPTNFIPPSLTPEQTPTQVQTSAPVVTALPKPQGAGERPKEANKPNDATTSAATVSDPLGKEAKKDEKVPDTDKNPVTVSGPETDGLSKNSATIEKITKKAAI